MIIRPELNIEPPLKVYSLIQPLNRIKKTKASLIRSLSHLKAIDVTSTCI